MSEPDDIEAIRERKRRELVERAAREGAGDTTAADDDPSPASDETGDTPPNEPIHVEGSDHLDELVGRHDVVLVDFHADWCGPCQMLEPTVETIARDTTAAVAKIDIDRHPDLASRAGVRGVPTLVLYADGEPVEQVVGVQNEARLRQLIDRHS